MTKQAILASVMVAKKISAKGCTILVFYEGGATSRRWQAVQY